MGDPGAGALPPDVEAVRRELEQLRLRGTAHASEESVPSLLAVVRARRAPSGMPLSEEVNRLLVDGIATWGDGDAATAVRCTFGLTPGTRLRAAHVRRRAAATVMGVSPDHFRKRAEKDLIDELAATLLALAVTDAGSVGASSAPVPADAPDAPGVADRPVRLSGSYRAAPVLREAHDRVDWGIVRDAYAQFVRAGSDDDRPVIPDQLSSYLTEALGRVSSIYFGQEESYVLHALAVLAGEVGAEDLTSGLFHALYDEQRLSRVHRYSGVGRVGPLLPTPFEAMVETARRFRDVNMVGTRLGHASSGILAGSTSYGRFYSVRGARADVPASSLDVVVVVSSYDELPDLLSALSGGPGVSLRSLDAARRRAEAFLAGEWRTDRTAFAAHIDMWDDDGDSILAWCHRDGRYILRVKVLSGDLLEHVTVNDAPRLLDDRAGAMRSMLEFTDRPTPPFTVQRNLGGRPRRFPCGATEVEGGVLRRVLVFEIHDGSYYSGVLQGMLVPRFDLRWDRNQIRWTLEAFRSKILERLRFERLQRPYEMADLSLAHPRTDMFAPYVRRRVDGMGEPG